MFVLLLRISVLFSSDAPEQIPLFVLYEEKSRTKHTNTLCVDKMQLLHHTAPRRPRFKWLTSITQNRVTRRFFFVCYPTTLSTATTTEYLRQTNEYGLLVELY